MQNVSNPTIASNRIKAKTINHQRQKEVTEDKLPIYETMAHGSVVNGATALYRSVYYLVLSVVLTFLLVVEVLTKIVRGICVGIAFLCSEFNTYFAHAKEHKPKLYIFSCIVVGLLSMFIISLSLLLFSSIK